MKMLKKENKGILNIEFKVVFAFGKETQPASKILAILRFLNWWWVRGFSSYLLHLISYVICIFVYMKYFFLKRSL